MKYRSPPWTIRMLKEAVKLPERENKEEFYVRN